MRFQTEAEGIFKVKKRAEKCCKVESRTQHGRRGSISSSVLLKLVMNTPFGLCLKIYVSRCGLSGASDSLLLKANAAWISCRDYMWNVFLKRACCRVYKMDLIITISVGFVIETENRKMWTNCKQWTLHNQDFVQCCFGHSKGTRRKNNGALSCLVFLCH